MPEFDIPLTRNNFAALVFATRESVSRSIKELSETGAIQVNGKHFRIMNLELLTTFCKKG